MRRPPAPRCGVRGDRALLLRRYPWGESSLLVHLLTREHGRIAALAKGAYRPTSGYCGALDLFDTLGVGWSSSARSELATLHRAEPRTRRRAIATDLTRYRAALGVLELVDLAARPAQAEPGLFDLAVRALGELDRGSLAAAEVLGRFDLDYLAELGLAPALLTCAACGGAAPPVDPERRRAAFSAAAGGRLCLACARSAKAQGTLVSTVPAELLDTARAVWEPAERRRPLPGAKLRAVAAFTQRFLEHHLETRPRSRPAAPPR